MSSSGTWAYGRIPVFNGDNYATWKAQIEAILHRGQFLTIVKGKEEKPKAEGAEQQKWIERDQDARRELILTMEPCIVNLVKNLQTSNKIWKFLEEQYERRGPRQKTEEFRKLINIKMCTGQSMEEYAREFKSCIMRLKELEATIDDDLLVVIFLDSLSDDYKDVQAAFDAQEKYPFLDTVISRLLEVSERKKDNSTSALKVNYHKSYAQKTKLKNKHAVEKEGYFPFNCRKCGKRGHKAKFCRSSFHTTEKVKQTVNSDFEQGFMCMEISNRAIYDSNSVNLRKNKTVSWCIDSGATSHMCNNKSLYCNLREDENLGSVKLASGQLVKINGIGTVKLTTLVNKKLKTISLYKTLFIPDLNENLISISKVLEKGGQVCFRDKEAIIKNKNNETLIVANNQNGLFNASVVSNRIFYAERINKTKENDSILKWHFRLGHLNVKSLKQMQARNMVVGLPDKFDSNEINCTTCIRAKQSQLPYSTNQTKSATQLLELVHSDISGPMRTESLGKARYYITFIDEHSRKIFVYFLRHKNEALDKFKQFKNLVENQTGLKIKTLRTDNGMEYCSKQFSTFLQNSGIRHELTTPYTPQQNGTAERANRTLTEMARCLMLKGELPEMLWAELINTSVFIQNRCPTKMNGNLTPEEIWSKKKPNVSFMKEIGAKCFVLTKGTNLNKFEPRSEEYKLIGYSEETKGFRLWKSNSRNVITSRDVVFCNTTHGLIKTENTNRSPKPQNYREFWFTSCDAETKSQRPMNNEQEIDEYGDDGPRCSAEIHESSEDCTESDDSYKSLSNEQIGKHTKAIELDPKNVGEIEEMENKEEWKRAMQTEYEFLIKNNTWEWWKDRKIKT